VVHQDARLRVLIEGKGREKERKFVTENTRLL
jgi:hypothetical protein